MGSSATFTVGETQECSAAVRAMSSSSVDAPDVVFRPFPLGSLISHALVGVMIAAHPRIEL